MASPLVSNTLQNWLLQRADRNHSEPTPIDISRNVIPAPTASSVFQSIGSHMILASLLRGEDISQPCPKTNGPGSSSGCSSSAGLTPPTPDRHEIDIDCVSETASNSYGSDRSSQQQGDSRNGSRRSSFSVSELLRKDSFHIPRFAPRPFNIMESGPRQPNPPTPPCSFQPTLGHQQDFGHLNPLFTGAVPGDATPMLMGPFPTFGMPPYDHRSLVHHVNYAFAPAGPFNISATSAFTPLSLTNLVNDWRNANSNPEPMAEHQPQVVQPQPIERPVTRSPEMEEAKRLVIVDESSRQSADIPTVPAASRFQPLQLLVDSVGGPSNQSALPATAPKGVIRSSPLDTSRMSTTDGSHASPASSTSASHSSASPNSNAKQALMAANSTW